MLDLRPELFARSCGTPLRTCSLAPEVCLKVGLTTAQKQWNKYETLTTKKKHPKSILLLFFDTFYTVAVNISTFKNVQARTIFFSSGVTYDITLFLFLYTVLYYVEQTRYIGFVAEPVHCDAK